MPQKPSVPPRPPYPRLVQDTYSSLPDYNVVDAIESIEDLQLFSDERKQLNVSVGAYVQVSNDKIVIKNVLKQSIFILLFFLAVIICGVIFDIAPSIVIIMMAGLSSLFIVYNVLCLTLVTDTCSLIESDLVNEIESLHEKEQ